MGIEEFPRTVVEFDKRFGSEEACRQYMMAVRWPDGYRCPACQCDKYWPVPGHLLECQACGRQTSLTAGTVMHGTRKRLRTWFRAMWWVCMQKAGGSAKGLQKLLGLGSYQTAWAWLHKLRRAMTRAARERLEGRVEVAQVLIGGEEGSAGGRQTFKRARIVVAVEVLGRLRKRLGRVWLRHVPQLSESDLVPLVVENVAPGSTVITNAWSGYRLLHQHGFVHEVRTAEDAGGSEMFANVRQVVSGLKRWLLRTHRGAVRPKHLQRYLDEFAFHHNRPKSRHVGRLFHRMLQGVTRTKPTPYWRLVGRTAPDRPLRKT